MNEAIKIEVIIATVLIKIISPMITAIILMIIKIIRIIRKILIVNILM